jgi:hypothetical protein
MTDQLENETARDIAEPGNEQFNWGSRLFAGTLVAILVFFWWLLIYSGGVLVHHG